MRSMKGRAWRPHLRAAGGCPSRGRNAWARVARAVTSPPYRLVPLTIQHVARVDVRVPLCPRVDCFWTLETDPQGHLDSPVC